MPLLERSDRWSRGAARRHEGRAWRMIASIVLASTASVIHAAPAITLSRTQVDFGRIPSQIASSVQPVFVTNTGDAALSIQSLMIDGPQAEEFAVSGSCAANSTLPPGNRCRIDLTLYAGFGTTRRSATLHVVSDAATPAPPVDLSATLDNGSAYIAPPDPDPDWIDFPAQPIGDTAAPAVLAIRNATGLKFTIDGLALAGRDAADFAFSSPCRVGDSFDKGATCAVTLDFTPRAAGPRSAELRITLGVFGISGRFTYSVTGIGGAAGAPTPDFDQHGLTGSWYRPSTSGQGIEIEVFADAAGPGTGFLQGSWFTFDHVAPGGAESQRWYTFDGNVASGQPGATFALYRNTGGNFNALPVTAPVQVGTVALALINCNAATMTYAFTDGSNRSGTIPLQRITPNVTCSENASRSTDPDFGYSGNGYDPATSGQGLMLEVNPKASAVFFAWYTYATAGQSQGVAGQRWYTGQGNFAAGARTLPVALYETTGGLFNNTMPSPSTIQVGTATITLIRCTAARLAFDFASGSNAGRSGTIDLVRVGPTPAGCGP